MKKVCVITGGGSGIGFATAEIMGRQGYYVILTSRTAKKLENAVVQLQDMGIEAEAFSCDITDRKSTQLLAATAFKRGEVKAVIHAAGMSPHMGDAQKIMETNALGTININDAPREYFPQKNSHWCGIRNQQKLRDLVCQDQRYPLR